MTSPFDALLHAAERDPEAAEGLALGYAALSLQERQYLIETLVGDAHRPAAYVLALLLSVEEDAQLAQRIAGALCSDAPARSGRDAGWAWGGKDDGGIAIARHLHGVFVEVFCVRWQGGEISTKCEPPTPQDRLADVHRGLGVPESAERLQMPVAIDRLAETLWRARRERGQLPEALRDLADLFGPY